MLKAYSKMKVRMIMSRKNNILDSLNKLQEKDVYSMLLYVLYKLKDDDKYSTLSSLMWALDKDSLLNFLTIFEGVEMKVPRIVDMKMVVASLQVYQLVNMEHKSLESAIDEVRSDEIDIDELKESYMRISKILYERYSGDSHA